MLTGRVAVPLGCAVEWPAQRDLERTTAGAMDPRGTAEAQRVRDLTGYACALGFVVRGF